MVPMPEPLPCPFCGRVPTIEKWHGGGPQKTSVSCEMDTGCVANPAVMGSTKRRAIDLWNTRNAFYISA